MIAKDFFNLFRCRSWLLFSALAVSFGAMNSVCVAAQGIGDDDELRFVREHGQTGDRTVNCLIKVHGQEYVHDFCTFLPSDKKDGSFTIFSLRMPRLQAKIELSASASKEGVASWNGPDGGRAPRVELGRAHSEGACWRVGDVKGKDETRLCAWNEKLAVDLPTPKEPPQGTKDFVYYGMRTGMYGAISARDGLDTDHARIVTAKSRDAAIILCRSNRDFTAECIASTLRDAPAPILAANCPAGTFTYALSLGGCNNTGSSQDLTFLGKNPHSAEGADFIIQYPKCNGGGVMDGSWASTYQFAIDAFALLCPKTLEKAQFAAP